MYLRLRRNFHLGCGLLSSYLSHGLESSLASNEARFFFFSGDFAQPECPQLEAGVHQPRAK